MIVPNFGLATVVKDDKYFSIVTMKKSDYVTKSNTIIDDTYDYKRHTYRSHSRYIKRTVVSSEHFM